MKMLYTLLFIVIQMASLVLTVVGIPICAMLAYLKLSNTASSIATSTAPSIVQYHWPRWAWLWDNNEDGVAALWYRQQNPTWSLARQQFTWSALRNPCNNLRYVRGVSKIGRPLWRITWGAKPGGLYFQAGWNLSGFPVLSGGKNIHDF